MPHHLIAPVDLPIGGRTLAEISIAISAEITATQYDAFSAMKPLFGAV